MPKNYTRGKAVSQWERKDSDKQFVRKVRSIWFSLQLWHWIFFLLLWFVRLQVDLGNCYKNKVVPQLILKLKKRSSLWLHQAFYLMHLSLELHKKYFVSLLMENENLLIITWTHLIGTSRWKCLHTHLENPFPPFCWIFSDIWSQKIKKNILWSWANAPC